MTEELQKEINTQIELLPKEAKEAVVSSNWQNISEEIAKKYFFDEDDINSIQAEISLVLLGLEYLKDLASNIENTVATTKNEAENMAKEFIEKIFTPLAQKLEENIKKNLDKKDIHWQQNLDFILSGGDYTAFIRRIEEKKEETQKKETTNGTINDLRESFTI